MAHNVSAIQSGDQVTVIVDGEHYRRSGSDAEHVYNVALKAQTNPTDDNVDELLNVLDPHAEAVADGLLERDEMGNYTLPNFRTPIPEAMAKHMLDLYDRGITTESFQNFWRKAMMNPNSQARNDMFQYCMDHGITITEDGYMILYKAVNNNPASNFDEDLIDFLGTNFLNVKRKGENPKDYFILQDQEGEYHLVRRDVLSSLQIIDLDEPIPPEVFTPKGEGKDPFEDILEFAVDAGIIVSDDQDQLDLPSIGEYDARIVDLVKLENGKVHWKVYNHVREIVAEFISNDYYVEHGTLSELYDKAQNSHDGQFEPSSTAKNKGGQYGMSINLGEPVRMPREKCDPNINESCSKGLHVGSYDYVDRFGSGMDTILACIVNPRDIVALPKRDNSKLRTCLYVPYAVMEREDGNWEEIEETKVDFEYMDERSDMDQLLSKLEGQDDLSDIQKDRKEIIEDRLQTIE